MFQRPRVFRILHSADEDNSSPFDSKIACLCHSININNNKHVCRHSQVQKPTGNGVEWAECSLIIGTGGWVQDFSLILDSSAALSASIQSAGHSVPETLVESCIQQRKTTCLLSNRRSFACARASKLTATNKHVCMYVRMQVFTYVLFHQVLNFVYKFAVS